MKILYAITAYPPSTGGAQTHFHEIAKRIRSQHAVSVACHWHENRTDWLRGVTLNAPGDEQYSVDGIPVKQINLDLSDRHRLAPWVWSYYLTMGNSVRRISECLFKKLDAQVGDIDLIHAGRIGREFLAWAALRLARRRKVPFVLTPFHHPKWSGFRWRWYLKLYREADAILALTESEKSTLAGLGVEAAKIHVVGHAPSLPDEPPRIIKMMIRGIGGDQPPTRIGREAGALAPAPGKPSVSLERQLPGYFGPGGPVVLFLGQKYEYKGLHQLAQSMPLVWKILPETRFAFIGPRTPYSRRLFRNLQDVRVIEKDRVPEAEKLAALADCSVFCLPSRQESFGGVFAEAWRLGKPVVGGNIPAVAEIIQPGQNGELVGKSPADLAAVLLKLLTQPNLAAALGRRGREKAEQEFTWEAVTRRVEKVYSQLTGRP